MTNHRTKNVYVNADKAQRAAARYTNRHGFKMRFYECDECPYFHIATVKWGGIPVISLDAIKQGAEDV